MIVPIAVVIKLEFTRRNFEKTVFLLNSFYFSVEIRRRQIKYI